MSTIPDEEADQEKTEVKSKDQTPTQPKGNTGQQNTGLWIIFLVTCRCFQEPSENQVKEQVQESYAGEMLDQETSF